MLQKKNESTLIIVKKEGESIVITESGNPINMLRIAQARHRVRVIFQRPPWIKNVDKNSAGIINTPSSATYMTKNKNLIFLRVLIFFVACMPHILIFYSII